MKYSTLTVAFLGFCVLGYFPVTHADRLTPNLTNETKMQHEQSWLNEVRTNDKNIRQLQDNASAQKDFNRSVIKDIPNQKVFDQNLQCLSTSKLLNEQKLTLLNAIERAVCRYPETRSAWIQTQIQAAQLKITKSNFYPQINTSLGYDWGRDNYQVDDRPDLSYDTDTRRYSLAVRVNWLLYDFGTRYYQVEEAKKLLAMSLAQNNVVLQNLIMKTISAYYQIVQTELKLNNIQQLVNYAEKNYEISNARYQSGVGIKSDVLQMTANLAKAKSEQIQFTGELKIAKGQLATLMGDSAYQNFNIDNQLKIPKELNLKDIELLIKEAEQLHPRFKAAQYDTLAAQAKITSIQRSKYPSLSFNTNYDQSKQFGESPFGNEIQRLQAGVQLNFPLFDGFNRKNQIVVAQENLKLKQLEEERLKLEINAEIWKSYNQLNAIHENIKSLALLNDSASQAYEVVQGRYKSGVGNLLEVLNAQNLLNEAQVNYSSQLTEFLVVRYQLLSNMGNLNIWAESESQ